VLCLRPEIPLQVGFLDEGYFLYFEDADFSCRVRKAGLRTVVLPGALAWHEGGASLRGTGRLPSYYRVRGRLRFSRQWNPYPWRGRLHRFLFGLRQVARAFARFLTDWDRDSLLPAMAVLDHLRGRRGARQGGAKPR
jgi:GT2 family glycosyltransferase